MEVKVDEKELEEILKDPDKLRGLARDLRAEAQRLEARATNPNYVSTRAICGILACICCAD